MSVLTLDQAMEEIYRSLANDNEDIDLHLMNLKTALQDAEKTEAFIEPQRLAQNNRAGRKMLQSYFKKRGVKVVFKE